MKYLVSLIFLFTLNLNAVEVVLQDPQLNEPAPKCDFRVDQSRVSLCG